jgi:linoleate 10R-lipoxygenase
MNRLRRTPSGSFDDADLGKLLYNAIEWRAAAFRARGIPETLRVIELMNIEKARKWGTCTVRLFETRNGWLVET